MANIAIDYINGTYMCPCEGSDGQAFVNLDTGEIQCAITCDDDPLCQRAVSYQDNQLNIICDPVAP